MKNQTGRPIAPARKLVAWIIGTIAAFVIALGLGMSSSPVAFFGVAVLAIAVAVAFMPAPRRGGRATVAGTAEVRSITPPPVAGAYGRATVQLIVVAPGLGTFETTVREPRIPVEKWPLPGATVPITVDVDDTRRVRVSWRDAPARRESDDLPPPPPPAGRNEPDDLDDEVFGSVDEPWEGRDDDWEVDPDGPGGSSGPRGTTTAYARRTGAPVVVRETAAGTIVEGHVVGTDEEPSPLPRRARPVQPETATYAAESIPVADPVEEPVRPAPATRTDPDPDFDPDADWPDPEPPWRSPDADPAPTGTAAPDLDPDPDLGTGSSAASGTATSHTAVDSRIASAASSGPASASPGPAATTSSGPASADAASRADADSHADADSRAASAGPDAFEAAPSGRESFDAAPSGRESFGAASSSPRSFGAAEPETAARTTAAFVTSPQGDVPPSTGPGPASGSWPAYGSASGRPPGSRPSPRPRGASATATAERDTPSGTAEASPTATTTTATQTSGQVPPAQRTSTESRPDPAIDLDLDGPPTSPVSPIPAQSTHGRARSTGRESTEHTSRSGPTTAGIPTQDAPEGPVTGSAGAATDARPEPDTRSGDPATSAARTTGYTDDRPRKPVDPVSPAGRRTGSAEPVSPAGRSADPISPAGRTTGPIDPVSPAGRSSRAGAREPGLTPPPPPTARRADAPTPPPPPVARPGHAAPPPPAPSRSARPGTGTREQNAWARPPESPASSTPEARPTPSPRSPASADERWAAPDRPVSPAPQPGSEPAEAGRRQPAPASADNVRQPAPTPADNVRQAGPAPADNVRQQADPPPTSTVQAQSGPAATETAQARSGPATADALRQQPGSTPAGSAWVQPSPARSEPARPDPARPASVQSAPDDEDRWAPAHGSAARQAASTVPPDVETRPLGSRTRFFAQPGEETESFETEDAEQARSQSATSAPPRPEPTPSYAASTPSPVAPPPTAPEPDRPFPSAPPPATPRPAPRPGIDQIDIPLDNFPLRGHTVPIDADPTPPPEDEPQAAAARADGIMARPAEEIPRPSALRDGILGVAVGRAAVSPDAFPTSHLDDIPAPGRGQERRGPGTPQPSAHQERAGTDREQSGTSREQPGTRPERPGTRQGQTRGAEGGEQRRNGPWGDFSGRPDEHAGDVITGYPSARPATAGSIHGVGITVLVTDLERSMEFYRDILGFHEIDNGDGSAVLASGDTRLVLRTVHNLTAEAGRLIYLNLEVGDIEAVHAELREKGVKFVHSPRPVNRGDKLELWSATFRDPDNHNIAITQWRAIH